VTRLIRAEASRLFSRRFTGMALLVLLLALSGYQLVVNKALSPLSEEQLATAQRAYDQAHQDWIANHEKYERDCRETGGAPQECAIPEPTMADFTVHPTPFQEVARTAIELSTVLVGLVAFLIAASFIGAEYGTGSIADWLTFIPHRGHVFWSKLLTLIGFGALLGAFGVALVLSAGLVLARLHASRIESVRELAGLGARSIVVVIGLAVLGFCIGLVTRHTAGAIGVLLAYLIVFVLRMGFLGERSWSQRVTPFTPEGNLAAILDHGYSYSVPVEKVTANGVSTELVQHTVSLAHGAIYWTILLAVVVVGSLMIFRSRDVV
jgi:ABC-2 type transport system permease protein